MTLRTSSEAVKLQGIIIWSSFVTGASNHKNEITSITFIEKNGWCWLLNLVPLIQRLNSNAVCYKDIFFQMVKFNYYSVVCFTHPPCVVVVVVVFNTFVFCFLFPIFILFWKSISITKGAGVNLRKPWLISVCHWSNLAVCEVF